MSGSPLLAILVGMAVVLIAVPRIQHFYRRRYRARRSQDFHHNNLECLPRWGGFALVAAFLVLELLITLFFPEQSNRRDAGVLVIASLAMFGLGLRDDLKALGARRKLFIQVVIASFVCAAGIKMTSFKVPFSGNVIQFGNWGFAFTILWLVGMTNLINLIDGLDGLASGICLLLMVLLTYIGHRTGSFELLAAGMAGALLAFLLFNFHPANIYLGDGGAYFLGFQIGFLSLIASHKGTLAPVLIAPLFVLAFPLLDLILAIVRRIACGLPIFRPDRNHLHHRLLEMGFSHRAVVLWIYSITLLFLVMGFLAFASEGELLPILLRAAVVILFLCVGRLEFSPKWLAIDRVLRRALEMRRKVQYALSLTHWLRLEAARHTSLESLWPNLVFVAERLGFTSISLTLADGVRHWVRAEDTGQANCRRYELRGGHSGVLELKAYSIEPTGNNQSLKHEPCGPHDSEPADPRLFQIISELVAEGWLKATQSWQHQERVPLSFSSKPIAAGRLRRVMNALYSTIGPSDSH